VSFSDTGSIPVLLVVVAVVVLVIVADVSIPSDVLFGGVPLLYLCWRATSRVKVRVRCSSTCVGEQRQGNVSN
jgi:hypothetical protein